MSSPIVTPNIGLQIPGFNTPNWNVPLEYDLQLLDAIFGGEVQVPAVNVATIAGLAQTLANIFMSEQPAGALPGNAFTLSKTPVLILAVFWNGIFQSPSNYTVSGATLTTTTFTPEYGDSINVLYFFNA